MSGFSAEWLALRELLDRRARNPQVLGAVAAFVGNKKSISIVDLGSGTGSTLRALCSSLPVPQRWLLVDNDSGLLARASGTSRPDGVTVETVRHDLSRGIAAVLDAPADLVTASALIDLVSEQWLAGLATAVAARSLPLYVALTYDGRTTFSVSDPIDAVVVSAFNRHQRTDKGFGPALGPMAAHRAIGLLEDRGYTVIQGESDWVTEPGDRAFQNELLEGWVAAAIEAGDVPRGDLAPWLVRRRQATEAGALSLRVGHVDFFAFRKP